MNDPEDFRRAAAGCIESRNRLVEQNLPLISWVAGRMYKHLRMCRRELISVGHETLIRIVPLFEPDRGNQFSTFAIAALRHDMVDASWTHRVISVRPDHGQYISARTREKRRRRAFDSGYTGVSLRLANAAARDSEADDAGPSECERAILLELMGKVDIKLREILEARFIHGKTCLEIAQSMPRRQSGGPTKDGRDHISRKRVQQLQMDGIRELDGLARARGLCPDWTILLPRAEKFRKKL